ncbi:BCL2/adenovirus E1B 19 kDa protein-interacting protein 3-like [Anneissia japonica]|uniref:BCL2/adenovirus E1B 19 kDa protein-interacting protein 3-like n=1 Tax=Anneissia japonica TaxID=1529436 RepID=UPI0014258E06|nr:BCL2/adenovirus E1B 19 kDa protein-interacting protein 3-like [Anneissia japonica]
MSSTPRNENDDNLSESWVELNYAQQDALNGSHGRPMINMNRDSMEKLLMEAQRESRNTSRGSSQGGSPKGPHSPIASAPGSIAPGSSGSGTSCGSSSEKAPGMPLLPGQIAGRSADWIWEWSSRPELRPSKDYSRLKHPEKSGLSIRKSKAMKSELLSADFLRVFIPSMLLTNILSIGIGIFVGLRIASSKSS